MTEERFATKESYVDGYGRHDIEACGHYCRAHFQCPLHLRGCDFVAPSRANLSKHMEECPKMEIICSVCNSTMLSLDYKNHKCCDFYLVYFFPENNDPTSFFTAGANKKVLNVYKQSLESLKNDTNLNNKILINKFPEVAALTHDAMAKLKVEYSYNYGSFKKLLSAQKKEPALYDLYLILLISERQKRSEPKKEFVDEAMKQYQEEEKQTEQARLKLQNIILNTKQKRKQSNAKYVF